MSLNNLQVDDLEKQFRAEMTLLLECSSNLGVCERIASRIIPMLLNHTLTMKLINEWDKENHDSNLLVRAYTELDTACRQILHEENINPCWIEGVKLILEEVARSGDCSNLSDKDCEGLHVDAQGKQSVVKILKAEPPCHRVYYKLKALYVSAISKTWDLTFAPSAYKLIQNSSRGEMAINIDADPRCIWKQLRLFKECWEIRNETLCIGWPKANGVGLEMWIEADQNFRRAFRCRLASDFSFASHYGANRKMEFFQPKILIQWVDRLLQEIILLLRQQAVNAKPKGPRAMKVEARKFTQNILAKELLPLPLKERSKRSYDSLRPIIWKAAKQSGMHGLVEACSETLINDECTVFAKTHGWKPKRGKGSAV